MKYTSSGFKNVTAETMTEAAVVFANRAAKRKYGGTAYCRTCTMGAYSENGSLAEFSAFVGYTTGRNETTGHNINFTVYVSANDGDQARRERDS